MQTQRFQNIKACVFDAYGTLFDVHSAVGYYRQQLGDKADPLSALWRTKQLEYTWLRSLMDRHADFWQITQDALDYAMDTVAIADSDLRRNLMEAYLHLECYPEVPEVLDRLRRSGLKTAILSNGTPNMLEAALNSAGLRDLIESTLSVEDVGIYKPHPRVYQLAVQRLGVMAEEISFQSSNGWDVAGAASFGLKVAWINRFGQRPERLPHGPHAELKTLSKLPALLGV